MFKFIILALSLISLQASASLQIQAWPLDVNTQASYKRNFICSYFLRNNVWRFWGATYELDKSGLMAIGYVLSDGAKGSSAAICSSHIRESFNADNKVKSKAFLFKNATLETVDNINIYGCGMEGPETYEVTQSAVNDAQEGHTYEITTPAFGGYATKMKAVNYFILPQENGNFMSESSAQKYMNKRCLEFVPGSVSGF